MLVHHLLSKGVCITEIYDETQEIVERWDNTFAQNISAEIKEAVYYSQFKWHMFSYEQQNCLKMEEARRAFDSIEKSEVYVMYQNSPEILRCKNANGLESSDFDREQDIYIFDVDYTWTYVHTHEEMCGPYFYTMNRESDINQLSISNNQ